MTLKIALDIIRNYLFHVVAIAIGVAVFCHYFDFSIIDPDNTAWMRRHGGDGLQHYLGSYALRADEWHFPITKTTLINYPEGVAIIYTDSNPLLSLIAKLIRGVFPPEYQFFGFWFFLCWILQGLLGYLVTKEITGNKYYALFGALLFCLFPTQIFRIGHANLVGFWLILWSILVFIHKSYSDNKKQFFFYLILVISAMVHAYLTVMCAIVAGVWFFSQALTMFRKNKAQIKRFLVSNTLYSCAFLLIIWCLGYFYNQPFAEVPGYGQYSMNLLAPFNPFDPVYSSFISPFQIRDGQYEGFQYLGMGIIVLLLFVGFLYLREVLLKEHGYLIVFAGVMLILFLPITIGGNISFLEKSLALAFVLIYILFFYGIAKLKEGSLFRLMIAGLICFVLALANAVYIGPVKVMGIHLFDGEVFKGFVQTIRSSGRLFWVTSHVLLLAGLYTLYTFSRSKIAGTIVLVLVCAFQVVDLWKLSYRIDSNDPEHTIGLSEECKNMIQSARVVKYLGASDMRVAEYALLNKKRVNNFHTAHHEGILTVQKLEKERAEFKLSKRDEDLLLFQLKDLPDSIDAEFLYQYQGNYYAIPPKGWNRDNKTPLFINKRTFTSLSAIQDIISSNLVAVISVCDEAIHYMPDTFKVAMDTRFGTKFRELGFRHSYLAVFVDGKLYNEQLGSDKAVEFSDNIEGVNIFVRSAGMPFGSNATIKINENDYSLNDRGLNLAAFNPRSIEKLNVLTTGFDTHGKRFPF